MSNETIKSPLARARDAWLESDEARMLSTIGPMQTVHLRNRLEVAFIAGYTAREAEIGAPPEDV